MSRVRITPMVAADLSPVLDLWRVTPGIGLNESDSPEALRRFLDRNPELSHVAWGPEDRVVGAVLCGHDGRRGYLHHLAVEPGSRRLGVGTDLVEACLSALRLQRILKCNLFVFHDNADGTAFWTKRGFQAPPWGPLQRVLLPG